MPVLVKLYYLKPWIVPATHTTEKPHDKKVKMNEISPVDQDSEEFVETVK